jgi:hypothetical protein
MGGILMLANPDWFAYHARNSVGGLAIFYASPHKWTERDPYDPLFCVRRVKIPRKILGVGRIQAQKIIDQDSAWEHYGTALGANSEEEWRAQASVVLEKSRKTYDGKMLAIELVDFRPFPAPVLPVEVGLTDTGWSDKKRVDDEATARLLNLIEKSSAIAPFENAEIAELKRQLNELWSAGLPRTPEVLRRFQRILKTSERPSSITRYVKKTRGTTCQLCGELGFVKRSGTRYCEVHHLFHLSENPPPNCLAPEYLVVLCATCHRRMHYADVGEPERIAGGWRVRVDDTHHHFMAQAVAPNMRLQRTRLRRAAEPGR